MTAPAAPTSVPSGAVRRSPVAVAPLGLLGGVVAGVGSAVLVQQYGIRPMTLSLLLAGMVFGAVIGIVLPTLGRAMAPAPSPAGPAPVAATGGTPVAGWAPTHQVPETGTWAWAAPDAAAQPFTSLAPSTEVQVLTRSDNWAQVRAVNGWEGWVDLRQLHPHAPPPTSTTGAP
jgi:hypothetical protein